mmetsp:Transcript_37288/g.78647  ORF Transcript_37288/g.78647 Transcript_37288/m.78647 type:complete len:114 (+) Transcript_37288:382-723(+)
MGLDSCVNFVVAVAMLICMAYVLAHIELRLSSFVLEWTCNFDLKNNIVLWNVFSDETQFVTLAYMTLTIEMAVLPMKMIPAWRMPSQQCRCKRSRIACNCGLRASYNARKCWD